MSQMRHLCVDRCLSLPCTYSWAACCLLYAGHASTQQVLAGLGGQANQALHKRCLHEADPKRP